MTKIIQLIVVFYFFIGFSQITYAQEDSTSISWDWYHVVKTDGTSYVAQVLSDDGREVLIYTRELGKIFVNKSDLKSMKKIDSPEQVVSGEYIEAGPFSTRYYLTTNAFPIKKGENYALLHLWGPEVHFSVTDRTSVGFMTTWIGSPMGFNVKHTIATKNPNLNYSLGTIVGSSGYLNSFRGFGGLHFGNVTYGNRMSNITFSAGFGYLNSGVKNEIYEKDFYIEYPEYSEPNLPTTVERRAPTKIAAMFSVSGITKVGTKASFIFDVITSFSNPMLQSETWSIVSPATYDANGSFTPAIKSIEVKTERIRHSYLIFMPGMRFQSTDNKAFQVAIAGVTVIQEGESFTFPLPMCSWFYKF